RIWIARGSPWSVIQRRLLRARPFSPLADVLGELPEMERAVVARELAAVDRRGAVQLAGTGELGQSGILFANLSEHLTRQGCQPGGLRENVTGSQDQSPTCRSGQRRTRQREQRLP